ncbi:MULTISPECIES: hypothetical protein [Pseudomonas]|uniref:hypothetical protein n=1 Tax=Pseudomonas TaxID=286 RepID=UPI000CD4DBAE|nr:MULTISPECIES: hypothetical protein [Pseudomonas]RBH55897.1 hypothetical protein C3F00_017670 [Pseudomonas sp. MWU13-2860]
MKWGVWALVALVMSGCASVSDIEQSPPTMAVISGKKPMVYAQCFDTRLTKDRGPSLIEPYHKDGVKVVVRDQFSTHPSAVLIIEERSSGSSIKVFESMSNFPLRSKAVLNAAEHCISG